jgi:uncharacterized protein with HEPN domain
MPRATLADRIQHILRSIALIEGYWAGKSFSDFEANEPLRSATERHLLIISEAVRHMPEDAKAAHPQIPWRDIAGIGNILRHGYDLIDPRRIWAVVEHDLQPLKSAVTDIVAREQPKR